MGVLSLQVISLMKYYFSNICVAFLWLRFLASTHIWLAFLHFKMGSVFHQERRKIYFGMGQKREKNAEWFRSSRKDFFFSLFEVLVLFTSTQNCQTISYQYKTTVGLWTSVHICSLMYNNSPFNFLDYNSSKCGKLKRKSHFFKLQFTRNWSGPTTG